MNRLLLPVLLLCALASPSRGDETAGFVEKFALAADREAVLAQLVPGTEEYYFYHALHFQNTRQKAKLTGILQQWAKRFPHDEQRELIENREALLSYDADPQATLKFLRNRLNLNFNHQQESRDEKPDLPTVLDPVVLAREVFQRDSITDSDDLNQCRDTALEALVRNKVALTPAQVRTVLGRLRRPDLPNLVELVEADLRTKESRGFGEFPIHRALLPDQLDELARRRPSLYGEQAFVFARLHKLAPGAEADPEFDPAEREAWLDRAWAYAVKLSPAFNSLKAAILHQRLKLDQSRGLYDEKRFLTYLKLPRRAVYVNARFAEAPEQQRGLVDLNASFSEAIPLATAIGNDEALLRDYFLHLFARLDPRGALDPETALAPWLPYMRDVWLRPVYAEAMITAGIGDPERWGSLLSPAAFQHLKERVDIDFAPANPRFFAPGAEVSLDLVLKNAARLIVKVYEINTLSYFLTSKAQLNTDLNLDGLVANRETTEDFSAEPGGRSPFLRTARTFRFPQLQGKRGAWVIEFIGGGKSSRALVRKGQWSLVQRSGPAGDLLTVLDETGRPVKEAVAWLDGRRFTMDEKAEAILIPFTKQPGPKPVVLADPAGTFASLSSFEHHAESYRLDAEFHLEREQLLAGRQATLALRAGLLLGATPVAPGLLGETRLTLTTTTLDGISTTAEVKAPKLEPERDFTFRFSVPERLASVRATLTGTVENLSLGGEKQPLSATREWQLNGLDRTEVTSDGHLSRLANDYVYELLGKNGEPLADRQIIFDFYHGEFLRMEQTALRTDEKGRVKLGPLAGIEHLEAHAPTGRVRRWELREFEYRWPGALHARAGETVKVPAPPAGVEVSLLELRADTFVADRRAAVRQEGGFLLIDGLAPGDYSLRLRGERTDEITLRITAGAPVAGWLVSPNRALEVRQSAPLQIAGAEVAADGMTLQLAHWDAYTRVHVAATRFLPEENLFTLGGFERISPAWSTPDRLPSLYAPGRRIGDEYRYILERRYTKIFPGNMLARPSLLLNPWETRSTDLHALDALGTEAPAAVAAARKGRKNEAISAKSDEAEKALRAAAGGEGTNLDFLATAAPVSWNLVPDAHGIVHLDRAALGDRQHLQIYAENLTGAVWRTLTLPEAGTKFVDLRLRQSLDPAKDLAGKKEASVLLAGQTLTLAHRLQSELEIYDSLASVFTLYTTLSGDATLAKFAWLLQWPGMKEEEKRAKYSEFSCHELNLFLSRKDPEFFRRVIAPYLAAKKEKTFVDEYLLGTPLQRWLQPWAYDQLNVAERCLLAQRLPGEAAATARQLSELRDLLPPDPQRNEMLFESAISGRMRETFSGRLGGAAGADASNAVPASPVPEERAGAKETEGKQLQPHSASWEMRKAKDQPASTPAPAAVALAGAFFADASRLDRDALTIEAATTARQKVRPFFRALGPAKEWAENQYYHLAPSARGPELITINDFWRDYARREVAGPFLSSHFAEASRNFSEMMFALAVLDLPFTAPKHATKEEGGALTLTAAGPLVAFHQEIEPAVPAKENAPLLVSQNFFRQDDRFREEGNERFDKYVNSEFLAGVVYGANIVVTNPTSSPQKLQLLLQIPEGALPVLGSRATNTPRLPLAAFTTQTFEYFFYFPAPSPAGHPFAHYPVHASRQGESAGAAKAALFKVVARLSEVDRATWDYVSQYGTEAEVIAWLKTHNLQRLDPDRIAWRVRKSPEFYRQVLALLTANHRYSDTLWSYALYHNDAAALREYLRHQDEFLAHCGPALRSSLLEIDRTERRLYEHLEYSPLVNQRAHRFTAENRIPNPVFRQQYQSLLEKLAHLPTMEPIDELSVVYYLFLQDRVEEALARFHMLKADSLPTKLQYDYFRCYAALYEEKLPEARAVVQQYADYPVDRWRRLFAEAGAQLDEIAGAAAAHPAAGPAPDREARQAELAATEPSFEFKVENSRLALTWKNLPEVTINYYLMEPEFLFSSSPFVTEDTARFAIIRPTRTDVQKLPADREVLEVPLPAEFAKANVLVEILGAGQRHAQAWHAHTLKLTLAENYGRLEVREQEAGRAVGKAYVKVYARLHNGTVRFYRDGYTDLRGRFDYASQNSSENSAPLPAAREEAAGSLSYQPIRPEELPEVEKFAILILSETHGALVREANPPAP